MTQFVIQVTIDPSGAVRGSKAVNNALKKTEAQSKKTSKGLLSVAKAVAASLVVREVVQAASLYQDLQNKLKLVTDGTQNLADVTDELFAISQRTRGSFEGTADLYSRVARSVTELGVSQRDTLQFTQAVSQAIAISGATAIEAKAGIVQLGQGLASGAIRGDELRSVLESLPGLAREIAAGLGVGLGDLRRLGGEGALTAEAVFGAIQKRIPQIEEQFGQLTPTIGQAFTILQNSGLKAVGILSEMTGGGEALSNVIIDVAEGVDVFTRAVTGTLTPTDDLSAGMIEVAIAGIAVGSALQAIFDLLSLGAGQFVAFGEGLGGIAAAFGALIDGDFDLAKAILADDSGFEKAKGSATDFFEDFGQNIDNASLKISGVLLPAFRDVGEAASTITEGGKELNLDLGAAAAAKALERLREKQAEFIVDQKEVIEAFRIAAETGKDFNRVLEDLQLITLSGGDEKFLAEAQALLEASRNASDYADAKERADAAGADNKQFIEDLAVENEALRIAVDTGRELNDVLEEMAIRKRFIGDEEGLAEALDLAEANQKLELQLKDAEDSVDDFLRRARENSQDILGGFLAGAFTEGLDGVGRAFSQMLLELASEALASEIFKLLGGIGRDSAGVSVGGILGGIGDFFGGAASGADVGGGDFGVVGENGPEVFQAPTAGRIVPNQAQAPATQVSVGGPTIINTIDSSDITGAFNGGEGDKVLLNRISTKRNAFRKALGV